MGATRKSLIQCIVILHLILEIRSRFEFTNVNCTSIDRRVAEFDYCYLKSVNRTYKYLSGRFKIYQPVTFMKLNVALWKRFNGYKPFLYNITLEACKFMDNQKSNPVVKFFFETFMTYSNMNHSYPYNHDIILDKLPIDYVNHRLTQVLPFPEGDYLFESHWLRSGKRLAAVRMYGTLS